MKKIFIASDHAGFSLKSDVLKFLKNKKFKLIDLGPPNSDSVDYPEYAHKLSKNVSKNSRNFGILICGTGLGMNITANKHKKIRAAQCFNVKSAKLSRLHNDANIITLGSRLLSKKKVFLIVNTFLKTRFEGGRHLRRIKKI